MNQLDQLKKFTKVVADTGDFETIKQYAPQDSTTNPSLILKAAEQPEYRRLIDNAYEYAVKHKDSSHDFMSLLIDKLFVDFGLEILKIVPGRVSTEVDARLSFDVEGTLNKARWLIKLYEQAGIARERVLIKIAATWEGGLAAKELEQEGIHCNMTLMFSLVQAVHCANSKATLISPFVGRILDWHKKNDGVSSYPPDQDPGVKSVTEIYDYYKKFGIKTEIMGASFRSAEEVLALAGCDLLTISPKFLGELQKSQGPVTQKLDLARAKKADIKELKFNEAQFRFILNDNAMATEKLAEGIRVFAADLRKLEATLRTMFKI